MPKYIETFTFERNSVKKTVRESSEATKHHIDLAVSGVSFGKTPSNIIGALRSYLGVVDSNGKITSIGEKFLDLYGQDVEDAWRWLLTRALWLYTVPNGTAAKVNAVAKSAGGSFSFFRYLVSLLVQLEAMQGEERFLYYDELAELLSDDLNWTLAPHELFAKLLKNRATLTFNRDGVWLADLETKFGIPKDNFGAYFSKCLRQTGLFEYKSKASNSSDVGIAIKADLDPVLRKRIRFVIDEPRTFSGNDWASYIQGSQDDLPNETAMVKNENVAIVEQDVDTLETLIDSFQSDLTKSGLTFERSLVSRFVASLLAKRFVILTGLSGSGKTKLAQAFAKWITNGQSATTHQYAIGDVLKADRIDYTVVDVDDNSIGLDSDSSKRVSLPFGLVREWELTIEEHGLDRNTSARKIREFVSKVSKYSSQLNSFETHLKALAFSEVDAQAQQVDVKQYELISVGADWVSRDSCLGYVDALDPNRYVRTTPIVDLILNALEHPAKPFFAVLDEMNLSHVERYFADFLSSAESGEDIFLHGGAGAIDGVPPSVFWPSNLFVIGTVNVDETTYTFSPKVLDRANTIEFRLEADQLSNFLKQSTRQVSLKVLEGLGQSFASKFVQTATSDIRRQSHGKLLIEIQLLFDILRIYGLEFGYRTASEILNFDGAFFAVEHSLATDELVIDAQILQKVLPRLNGSRRKLEGPLCALAKLCVLERNWDSQLALLNRKEIFDACSQAGKLMDLKDHPLSSEYDGSIRNILPATLAKVMRMLKKLDEEGFASFAEA